MHLFNEAEVRRSCSMTEAVVAAEASFAALARGDAELPPPLNLDVYESHGEVHVRAAHVKGAPYIVLRIATGFWENRAIGLPTGNGLMLALDAGTRTPMALLEDRGFLTELRTGGAGAVAAKYLARAHLSKVALIGAGEQAPFQIEGLSVVRRVPRVDVWSRSEGRAASLADQIRHQFQVEAPVASTVESAVREADLIITATPSHAPLVRAEWLTSGVHITAVGADGPAKQELAVDVLERADLVVADRLVQCLALGEIHHAVEAGAVTLGRIHGDLGDIVRGKIAGPDLARPDHGGRPYRLGTQDHAVATLVLDRPAALDS